MSQTKLTSKKENCTLKFWAEWTMFNRDRNGSSRAAQLGISGLSRARLEYWTRTLRIELTNIQPIKQESGTTARPCGPTCSERTTLSISTHGWACESPCNCSPVPTALPTTASCALPVLPPIFSSSVPRRARMGIGATRARRGGGGPRRSQLPEFLDPLRSYGPMAPLRPNSSLTHHRYRRFTIFLESSSWVAWPEWFLEKFLSACTPARAASLFAGRDSLFDRC